MGRTTRDSTQPGTASLRRLVLRAYDGRAAVRGIPATSFTAANAEQCRNGWDAGYACAWAWLDDGGAADAVTEATALGVAGRRRRQRRCWLGLGR